MRSAVRSLPILMLLGFALCGATANTSLQTELQPLFDEFSGVARSSGTLLIERAGEQAIHAYGMANDSTSTQNSGQTIFGIASMSKQITATAVLRLVDQGLLKLDTPVAEIFPEFRADHWSKNGTAATVHHLLSNTADTPDAYTTEGIKKKLYLEPISIGDILKSIRDLPISFAPGTKWEYSNTGFILLGEIVRRRSGKSYEQFMREQLFSPFPSMSVGPPMSSALALSYTSDAQGKRVPYLELQGIRERHDDDIFTDGNIYTTAADLKSWTKALASGKLLSPEMTQRMFTPVQNNYGYGWKIYPQTDGSTLYAHSGSWIGYTGDLVHIPEKKFTLVWLRNQEGDREQNDQFLEKVLTVLLK